MSQTAALLGGGNQGTAALADAIRKVIGDRPAEWWKFLDVVKPIVFFRWKGTPEGGDIMNKYTIGGNGMPLLTYSAVPFGEMMAVSKTWVPDGYEYQLFVASYGGMAVCPLKVDIAIDKFFMGTDGRVLATTKEGILYACRLEGLRLHHQFLGDLRCYAPIHDISGVTAAYVIHGEGRVLSLMTHMGSGPINRPITLDAQPSRFIRLYGDNIVYQQDNGKVCAVSMMSDRAISTIEVLECFKGALDVELLPDGTLRGRCHGSSLTFGGRYSHCVDMSLSSRKGALWSTDDHRFLVVW